MIIRPPQTVRLTLRLNVPAETAAALDRIKRRAEQEGASVDLAGDVAAYIERRVRAVEKQLKSR
jgi:hypothetical protein